MIKYLFSKMIRKMQLSSLRNCHISKHVYIAPDCNLINCSIDSYSYLGRSNSFNNVKIGKFCSVASYCAIGGDQHPTDYVSTSIVFYRKKNALKVKKFANCSFNENFPEVVIGNDVWIGEKVFIKSGVKIGDGAIIGAHSVVTHDVEPYSIVCGSPAKIIRFRFSEDNIDFLEKLQWWNLDLEKIEKYSHYFEDIETLKRIVNEEN